jgi:hypothetical protein
MSVIPDGGKPSLMEMMKAAAEAHQSMRPRLPNNDAPDAIPIAKERRVVAPVNNPSGGTAPPLTLLKRIPEQEAPMPSFSDLIKSADRLLRSGDYEGANEAADAALRMVEKAKARTHEDDDDTVDDTWSSAADDDEDEDNGSGVKKWSDSYTIPGMGGTPSPEQPEDTRLGPRHKPDTYNTGITATTALPLRSKFDARVDLVQQRDGVSRSIAMQRARVEFPADYRQHQAYIAEAPTNAQHLTRHPVGAATKRAPTYYEDLVSAEMAKGCNYEMARVRVAQLHGYDAQRMPSLMRKGADLGDRFARIVKSLSYEHDISLEEATRLARKLNPTLYRAMNSV